MDNLSIPCVRAHTPHTPREGENAFRGAGMDRRARTDLGEPAKGASVADLGADQLVTVDEVLTLSRAQNAGWYMRSGRKLSMLRAFQDWCHRIGKPCIVGIKLATIGMVIVDGVERWQGNPADLDAAAERIVAGLDVGQQGQFWADAQPTTTPEQDSIQEAHDAR